MSALLAHLPPDSALRRDMGLDWSVADELLALNAEISFEVYRAALATGGVKGHRLPKPLKIPRPHQNSPQRTVARPHRHAASVEDVINVLRAGHTPRGG